MKKTKPKSISQIANPDSIVAGLQNKAQKLILLDKIFQSCVPKPMIGHVSLATIRDGLLVACADSPTWATNMRYDSPEILQKLKKLKEFPEVHSIKLIQSRGRQSKEIKRNQEKPKLLSEEVRDLLLQQSTVLKNKRIQNSLRKLAKNIK